MDELEKDPNTPVTILLKPKGPATITGGNFVVIDEDGNEMEKRERISICRCGLSQKWPICDGAHKGRAL